jgi:hypothetical protein
MCEVLKTGAGVSRCLQENQKDSRQRAVSLGVGTGGCCGWRHFDVCTKFERTLDVSHEHAWEANRLPEFPRNMAEEGFTWAPWYEAPMSRGYQRCMPNSPQLACEFSKALGR